MFPMGVGTTYNAAFNSRSSTYNQWKLGGSFVMTSKYSTSAAHNRTLLALLHRSVLMALALMLIASCATPPPAPPKPREPVTDYPMPSRDKVEKTDDELTRLMPELFLEPADSSGARMAFRTDGTRCCRARAHFAKDRCFYPLSASVAERRYRRVQPTARCTYSR